MLQVFVLTGIKDVYLGLADGLMQGCELVKYMICSTCKRAIYRNRRMGYTLGKQNSRRDRYCMYEGRISDENLESERGWRLCTIHSHIV